MVITWRKGMKLIIVDINILLFTLLCGVYSYVANPFVFQIILKDIRVLRVIHYELMLLLGVVLALTNSSYTIFSLLNFSDRTIINIILCLLSIFFACLFSIVTNNLADVEIDKVCNKNRPLITNEIDVQTYCLLGTLFLVLAIFYAAMVSIVALFFISICIGIYYLYSMPPFRLKRITLFSKLAISINSTLLVLLGYRLVHTGMDGFPLSLLAIFLLGFTVAANFIDIKDIKGDSAAGIITLPILLGKKPAKILIGSAFWLTYLAFFYLIQNDYLIPILMLGGGLQFYLINKEPYHEWQVLFFHNMSILSLICYFIIMKCYF